MQVTGTLRLDKKTKELANRLRPGDIALIDHEDIDSMAAQMLVEARVGAVINASKSSTGRYPNLGPLVLLVAGIPVVDDVGTFLFKGLHEGEKIELKDGAICRNGDVIAEGELLSLEQAERLRQQARRNLGNELEAFATNTLNYVTREKSLLLDPTSLPDIDTRINGRHALVVVRGDSYKDDLAIIQAYVRDVRPVLIGVDGGADALVELGLKPDIVVGDMDSITDSALRCGAELIVHGYANGDAPGMSRLKALGLEAKVCTVPGTSEDLALLLAYEKGAELIVAVGTHSHLVDFLDKGRKGMASTFLVRLKVGNRLVDAKGVSKLYQRSQAWRPFVVLALSALVVIGTVFLLSPTLQERVQAMTDDLRSQIWHLWVRLRMWEK